MVMNKTVTKCQYYRNGSGAWMYRCWYDGEHESEPDICDVRTNPEFNAPPANAFIAVVRSITLHRGLLLGCLPELCGH